MHRRRHFPVKDQRFQKRPRILHRLNGPYKTLNFPTIQKPFLPQHFQPESKRPPPIIKPLLNDTPTIPEFAQLPHCRYCPSPPVPRQSPLHSLPLILHRKRNIIILRPQLLRQQIDNHLRQQINPGINRTPVNLFHKHSHSFLQRITCGLQLCIPAEHLRHDLERKTIPYTNHPPPLHTIPLPPPSAALYYST